MAEYKPWKDGTVSPQQGNLQALKELRCHIMNPWPEEVSKARDECTRVLHRMREQLNIVINLQSKRFFFHFLPSLVLSFELDLLLLHGLDTDAFLTLLCCLY